MLASSEMSFNSAQATAVIEYHAVTLDNVVMNVQFTVSGGVLKEDFLDSNADLSTLKSLTVC